MRWDETREDDKDTREDKMRWDEMTKDIRWDKMRLHKIRWDYIR